MAIRFAFLEHVLVVLVAGFLIALWFGLVTLIAWPLLGGRAPMAGIAAVGARLVVVLFNSLPPVKRAWAMAREHQDCDHGDHDDSEDGHG